MSRLSLILVLACCGFSVSDAARANPIRKVVTMLQEMEAKVKAEGKKEEALYEKFMCYCETGVKDLQASIAAAEAKIESLTAGIKADLEKLKQTKENSKEHIASRDAAKAAMKEATEIRKKENTAYNQFKSDQETNIDAAKTATAAIEKGMGGSFLQTSAANKLRKFAMEKAEMSDEARSELLAFLAGSSSQGYAPASGEIVGILKQMTDTMVKDLSDATKAEKEAIQTYEGLMSAKTKEVNTLQKQIEAELKLIGELEMATADAKNDLEETEEALAADKKFLAELEKGCATKTSEWEEVCRMRAQELVALAETIKVLNDDDALELFKKTLPGSSASLLQMKVNAKSMKKRALDILRSVPRSPQLDLVQMMLSITPGQTAKDAAMEKKGGFATIIAMIDDLCEELKKEQVADETKKEYCETELDKTEDKKKVLENSLSDSNKAIEDMEGAIATLADEIAALKAGIKALDKAVAEATALRKEEHADFEDLIASDTAAREILKWATNRLNKFYNPKLYKPPPKKEMSRETEILENMAGEGAVESAEAGVNTAPASLVQVSLHQQDEAAPPPPPETFGPYQKKSEEGNGVIQMIGILVADLDKEMQTAKVDEKNAQEEYEAMIADSADKRKADTESMLQKESEKASTEEALDAEKENKADLTKDLLATAEYLASVHGDCDWLLKFFDVRKEARAGEIDALTKAKAVLSGADYSLLQSSRAVFLSRRQ